MFATIEKLPDDPILRLSQLFKADPRTPKIDVGVGVFQNAQGETPIMAAVKAAEGELLQQESSKSYIGLLGNPRFDELISELVLGDAVEKSRRRTIQAVAGTGAVRLMGESLHHLMPQARLYLPEPTWGNHRAIFSAAGFPLADYPYYDRASSLVAREQFFSALEGYGPQDLVLFHGCCHNPSGADLSPADWDQVAEIAQRRGFLPIIDLAYMGFGESLEQDAYGVRKLAGSLENIFIAVSCSKNFGLYKERVGAVIMVGKNAEQAEALQSHFASCSRAMVSMAPDHGAEIVARILGNPELRRRWEEELNQMSQYMRTRRQQLATALTAQAGGNWQFITDVHRGMFSLLPLGAARVQRLREEFAIYMVGEGRTNIAGLRSEADIAYLAEAIAKVL